MNEALCANSAFRIPNFEFRIKKSVNPVKFRIDAFVLLRRRRRAFGGFQNHSPLSQVSVSDQSSQSVRTPSTFFVSIVESPETVIMSSPETVNERVC